MSKPWADMSREELVVERGRWEAGLQELNTQLSTAKRRARAEGKFLGVEELADLERRRLKQAAGVRGVQSELTKRKAQAREAHAAQPARRPFSAYFQDAADELLDDAQYNMIHDEARLRMAEDAGA